MKRRNICNLLTVGLLMWSEYTLGYAESSTIAFRFQFTDNTICLTNIRL